MDTDGNAAETGNGPDVNDPVMIPSVARKLECERQPTPGPAASRCIWM